MMNILRFRTIHIVDQDQTGNEARAYRSAHDLSLRSVAKEMGVSAMYLSHLETGKRKWNQAKAERFAEAVRKLSGESTAALPEEVEGEKGGEKKEVA